MTLIDDARRLQATNDTVCVTCLEWPPLHADDCPWSALPRIVEALETAQAMLLQFNRIEGHYPTTIPMGQYKRPEDSPTIEQCMAYCMGWPCEVAQVEPFAEKLSELLQGRRVEA